MYDLHNLGWHSFQQLCLTISREILGQTVESFLDSSDAGKDGAFSGTWKPAVGESLSGRFVIQCKFTGKRDKTLGKSDIVKDVEKARKLVEADRCDCYILITNAGVTGAAAEDIATLFKHAGVKQVRSFGSTWICQQIRDNKRLRMLVPRLYGLGDLSQILDERAYSQAKALLESLKDDLSKVVLTDAYRKAAEALDQHGFVLLIGEPAAGKTTIASMLSMGALDKWGASTLKLDTAEKVIERWNPDEPSQFFWIDDAFGVTQYESFLVRGWNHVFPQIRTMLAKGAKVVMTSRDYIYNRARKDLKESAFPILRESQVVIDVRDLSIEEKQQILYNHIKLGKQELAFRRAIKPHLLTITNNPRFIPETARRLADPVFTTGININRYELSEFVEKQERFLKEVLNGLDVHSKAALALIYMRDGSLASPVKLEESERDALERLGSSLGGCISALDSLSDSLVQHISTEGNAMWTFKHPTVGDAYSALLLTNPEWLSIFVQGAPIDKLLGQVTCGDVGLERAVILPRGLFPLVLKRLKESPSTKCYKTPFLTSWYTKYRVDNFLASRCCKDFLVEYIKENPQVLNRVSKPEPFLRSGSEVDLAIRLHEVGLLPENDRHEFVTTVVDYAIEGVDFDAIGNFMIRSVFTSDELTAFHERLRSELVPKLSDVRWTKQSGWRSDQSADEYMDPLLDSFSNIKEEFADDPTILATIDREIELGRDWIADNLDENPKEETPARLFGDVDSPDYPVGPVRSIFDDIDE